MPEDLNLDIIPFLIVGICIGLLLELAIRIIEQKNIIKTAFPRPSCVQPPSYYRPPKPVIAKDELATHELEECVVCSTNKKIHMITPCNHVVACNECKQGLIDSSSKCPICRRENRG